MDYQGYSARELCVRAGLDAEEYVRGEKSFGMTEIHAFARALLPEYGLAIHNSQAANAKVFEATPTEGTPQWLNILNLGEHFMPITSSTSFFCQAYWCEQCNRTLKDKAKHACIDICQACKSTNTQDCLFRLGKLHLELFLRISHLMFYVTGRTKTCATCHRGFFGEACYARHLEKKGKQKFTTCQSLHLCLECGVEFNPRSRIGHKCGYSKCPTCQQYMPEEHECFMQPFKFPDEVGYERAGTDEDLIAKADDLARKRQRKSRYVIWDLEAFALNHETGKGMLVPHFIVAATTCFNCTTRPFVKRTCEQCRGSHMASLCLSAQEWLLDNDHTRTASWAESDPCEECGQQLAVFRAGKLHEWSFFKQHFNTLPCILQATLKYYLRILSSG